MKCTILTGISLLFITACISSAQANLIKPFDYYLLSLSWSPEFCNTYPKDAQCSRHYGLVLHGLWPQYNQGYPQSCSTQPISISLIRRYFNNLYPTESLAIHEWHKHGTCSGLSPRNYLLLSQKLKKTMTTPKILQHLTQPLRVTPTQLKRLVQKTNPMFNATSIALSCSNDRRFLKEIYLCFNKKNQLPVVCGRDVQQRSQKSCAQTGFLIRNIW